MNREEIRQEAEEHCNEVMCTVCENKTCTERIKCREWRDRCVGYYCGAESRENKIADIKANCDLAIEGRDIKIKELELELTVEKDQHQEEINLHLHAEDYIKSLEKENEDLKGNLELWESGGCRATKLFECGVVKELKEQIEKMKCCYNCSKWYDGECEESPKSKTFFCADFKCDKWEIE